MWASSEPEPMVKRLRYSAPFVVLRILVRHERRLGRVEAEDDGCVVRNKSILVAANALVLTLPPKSTP